MYAIDGKRVLVPIDIPPTCMFRKDASRSGRRIYISVIIAS
jgi:hypothetical protein